MLISKFYDIWPTLRHVGNMLTTFPTKVQTLLHSDRLLVEDQPFLTYIGLKMIASRVIAWQSYI